MHVVPGVVQNSQFEASAARFTAAHRLLRKSGFGHVIQAENIASKHFKIFFVRNDCGNARVGIISSKKVLRRAVDRNHAKRTIRETFRQHKIKSCELDIVVMVKSAYILGVSGQSDELDVLLGKVESKCAES